MSFSPAFLPVLKTSFSVISVFPFGYTTHNASEHFVFFAYFVSAAREFLSSTARNVFSETPAPFAWAISTFLPLLPVRIFSLRLSFQHATLRSRRSLRGRRRM